MKTMILASAGLLLLFAFSACEKVSDDCQLIPAKIIRYDCDRVIFQVLATEDMGDDTWTDAETNTFYRNVVSYFNTCKIGEFTTEVFDTLYVRVKRTNQNFEIPGCIQCLAISPNPPQTEVNFFQIQQTP